MSESRNKKYFKSRDHLCPKCGNSDYLLYHSQTDNYACKDPACGYNRRLDLDKLLEETNSSEVEK